MHKRVAERNQRWRGPDLIGGALRAALL